LNIAACGRGVSASDALTVAAGRKWSILGISLI
jgi:hypothetical protein